MANNKTVIKQPRIKVSPEGIQSILGEAVEIYGTCNRPAIFNALAFRCNSARAQWIREVAVNKYDGQLIHEEKVV